MRRPPSGRPRAGTGRCSPRLLPRGQDQLAAGRRPVAHHRAEQAPLHRIAAAAHPRVQATDGHQCRVPDPAGGGVLHQAGRRPLPAARRVLGHHDRPDAQLAVRPAGLDRAARRLPQQPQADRSALVQARRLLSGADRGQPLERQDGRWRRRRPALFDPGAGGELHPRLPQGHLRPVRHQGADDHRGDGRGGAAGEEECRHSRHRRPRHAHRGEHGHRLHQWAQVLHRRPVERVRRQAERQPPRSALGEVHRDLGRHGPRERPAELGQHAVVRRHGGLHGRPGAA